jgi:NAD(P)-dependent dehydrogenase (short-subunit alcohol dehydrogenase family)
MTGRPRLAGRRALVSGAGRGLGRAIAIGLANEGASVAVNDRDLGPAQSVAKEIEMLGGRAVAFGVSIDDHNAARAMVDDAAGALGGLDALVNNAGIASSGHRVIDTPVEEIQALLDVHALGSFVLSQAALPSLRDAVRADIVMISSIATELFGPNAAPYTMAKAALEALAYTLAKEERRNGIRVNVIAPGTFDTRLGREVVGRIDAARRNKGRVEPMALADPTLVANAVVDMLACEDADNTGTRVRVSG